MDEIVFSACRFFKNIFIHKNKKYLVLFLLLLLLAPVVIGRLYFILMTKDYHYKGTILSYQPNVEKEENSPVKFFFINPNSGEDYVMVNMRKVLEKGVELISFPVLSNGEVEFLVVNDRDEVYVYQYKNGKQELLKLNGAIKLHRYLGFLHRFKKKMFFV